MNMKRRRYQLVFNESGRVELLLHGATVWASDSDPDFNEQFGDDVLAEEVPADGLDDPDEEFDEDEFDEDELIEDVLGYLVKHRYLTTSQAEMCDVVMPPEEDDAEEEEEELDA